MSKFKVGDEVRLTVGARNIANNLGDGNIYIVEDVKSDGIKLKGLFPYYHYSLFEIVEILKESNMNKFKVGDKVVRTSETYGKAIKGGVYEVSGICDKNEWAGSCRINLKGHEGVSGEFKYESSCFELYVEGVLTPLEAAEAMLKDKDIEFLSEVSGEWRSVGRPYSQQCLKTLYEYKLRHKPKTVVINGVEVAAPANKDSIGYKFYVVDVPAEKVHEVYSKCLEHFKHYWATEEDAQKALDAMLIPFNNLNKGDK